MELSVRVIGIILRILKWLLAPLWWGVRERNPLVVELEPWLTKSGTYLAKAIREGEITSEEIVRKYIKHIQIVNRYLNAVSDERFHAAIQDAKAVDLKIEEARRDGRFQELVEGRPLLGVPFTVKESCSLAGLSNSVGCLENLSSRATHDGAAVTLLKNAGGIPLLVSNTPELCLGWETSNLIRGTTNNPYDLNRTPGGSSGGEAALVSSGASPLSLSSDIAGSIRVPAAFCGLFGFKPSPGIVPIEGHIPTINDPLFPQYLTFGPITRYSEDLELMMRVLAGDKFHQLRMDEEVDLKDLKVYYQVSAVTSIAAVPVEKSISDAILRSVSYLSQHCHCAVMEEKFPELEDSVDISISEFFSMSDIPNMLQDPTNPKHTKNLLLELVKYPLVGSHRTFQSLCFSFIQMSRLFISESKYPMLKRKADQLRNKFIRVLSTNGILIYPVFHCPAFHHNQIIVNSSGVMYSMVFNILGVCAVTVPVGKEGGLPVCVQVIAAPNQDRLCLAVAKQLEKAFGGWSPPS